MSRVLRNKILLVGTGLLDFVKGIYQSSELEFPQDRVDNELKKSNGLHSGIIIPWRIETKYYTATVEFWLDELEGDDKAEVLKSYVDPDNGIGDVVDALVYVFRKDKRDSFEGIKEWLPFVEKHEPSILMCAGLPAGEDNVELPDIEDWCLDHQFEYVDLDEKTVEPLDKAGWDLAVDILQTNLWDGMTEHKATAQRSEPQGNEGDEELMRGNHEKCEKKKAKPKAKDILINRLIQNCSSSSWIINRMKS
ncbi:hypothetical protein BX666DRAFT_1996238 [Dichotomocladium elegans]|nr:hypothetical protein BX666DRAFT_1996238 [Dichotomocladium elegans]